MRLFFGIVVAVILATGVVPILAMLYETLVPHGGETLSGFLGLLATPHALTLLFHSVEMASLVTIFTFLLGIPLGLLFGKTDLPLHRFFVFLFLVPLMIPPYVYAIAWSDLLQLLDLPAENFSGLFGTVFVLFGIYLPIPMLLTMIFVRTVPPSLEEAGRIVTSWPGTLRGITLPLIFPALLLAAMLVFLFTLGEFSVPMFLRFDVYAVESFTQFSAFYNFRAAVLTALPLIFAVALLTFLENRFLRERTVALDYFAREDEYLRIDTGRLKWPLLLAVALLAILLVAAPLAALLVQAGGMENYLSALNSAGDALARSLLYALIGASSLAFFGFFAAYFIQKKLCCARFIDPLTLFLFTLPGTVIAIALIMFWNTPWTNIVYATPLLVLFGYLAKYMALANRISLARLSMIPPSMEEAAQMVGAGWFRRLFFIVIPLAKPGILGAWIVAALFILRDTSVTMLLYPPGHDTLPVRIFTMMANGSPQHIASLCIVMVATVLIPASFAWRLLPARERER